MFLNTRGNCLPERQLLGYSVLVYAYAEIRVIQRCWRSFVARRRFKAALTKMRYLVFLVTRIQRWWRRMLTAKRRRRRNVEPKRVFDLADIKAALLAARHKTRFRE